MDRRNSVNGDEIEISPPPLLPLVSVFVVSNSNISDGYIITRINIIVLYRYVLANISIGGINFLTRRINFNVKAETKVFISSKHPAEG